jgi:hypothetical protein
MATTLVAESHMRKEIYDADVMEKLLTHPGIAKKEKDMLRKYKKRAINGNIVQVSYIYGKNLETAQIGRLCAENGMGLANFSRNIRSALAQTYYWDLDMENAQPTILANLAKEKGWNCEKTLEFIEKRSDILKYIMENEQLTRGEAKDICIALFFGGWRDNHPFFEDLYKELCQIKENCKNTYPDIYKLAEKKKKEPGNDWKDPKAGCMALVLQDTERKILLELDKFLKTKGRPFDVLIHDGGLVRKFGGEDAFPDEILREAEAWIKEKMNYEINLAVKPCQHTFEFVSEEDMLGKMMLEFNKNHFYLKEGNVVCEEDENGIMHRWSVDKAQEALAPEWKHDKVGAFVKFWSQAKIRRTYERLGFFPGKSDGPFYNIYKGPIASMNDDDGDGEAGIESFKELIAVLMKRDPAQIDFLTKWIAHLFQYPEQRISTCIIFTGDMGLGKDMLWDFIGIYLLGHKLFFNSEDPENEIFGTFTNEVEGKLLVKLEEVSGSMMRQNENRIKKFISSPTQKINIKNISSYTIEKFSRVVMTTNEAVPVVVEKTDRRYNIFYCGDEKRGDLDWFQQTWDNMMAGRHSIYKWLMSIDLTGYNPNKLFKTEYHQLLAEGEKPTQEEFIDQLARNKHFIKVNILSSELYKNYIQYCDENNYQKCNPKHFGRTLSPYIAKGKIIKGRDNKRGVAIYTIIEQKVDE